MHICHHCTANLNGLRIWRYSLAPKKLSGKEICCMTKWFVWKLDNLNHLYLWKTIIFRCQTLNNLIYFSCLQQNNNGLSRLILEKIKPSSSHSCLSGSSSYTQTNYSECCTPLVIYYFYCHKCSNFCYIIHSAKQVW